jgi:integrase
MGVIKRRNSYEVSVYDPALGRKRYVGRREKMGDAKDLFAAKTAEFKKTQRPKAQLIRDYADGWLENHHGPGTRRPRRSTLDVNEKNIRLFVREFGDRPLDGIARQEALRWSKPRQHVAKVVSAMFNDAIDEQACTTNPFANRRQEQKRGRKDIAPITEAELDTLAQIALEHWGRDGYGIVARAWVLFAGWVGCRPGETCTVPLRNVDLAGGLVSITRVKPPYDTDEVVLPAPAADAVRDAMPFLTVEGPMFRTLTGKLLGPNLSWHWAPVRDKFEMTVTPERWNALLGGQTHFDFYSLRHGCASFIVANGGNEYDVAGQLGNSPEVCRDTYIHEHVDQRNKRNRLFLERGQVVDLDAARERRGA